MGQELSPPVMKTIKDAANKLTGSKRNVFEANVAIAFCEASVRNAVAETTAIAQKDLPSERTIRRILNRLGYRMRRVEKTKPLKKVPETDDIFENIKRVRDEAGQDPHCLRISIDTKAKVRVGEFSRRGRSRGKQATRALDHDMKPKQTLVPFGILEVACAQLFVVFGDSRETSDFIVDGLQLWWEERRAFHPAIHKLVIELDNGPSIASNRRQFIRRLTDFADGNNLTIELSYFPPYHSKYNPIERCWGVLECHWNGAILDTVERAVQWTASMTWKGIRPIVKTLQRTYDTGISLSKQAFDALENRLQRSATLAKWNVVLEPQSRSGPAS